MASYAGIWRVLDHFFFEIDCFFGMRETRTRYESWRRHSTVGNDYIDFRLLRQTNIAGQMNLAIFDYTFKCRHLHNRSRLVTPPEFPGRG